MQPTVTTGNAAVDGAAFNGWFIGDLPGWLRTRAAPSEELVTAAAGLRATSALEVKWGIHPAGIPRPAGWAPASDDLTLSVLISGHFEVVFRAVDGGAERRVFLRTVGDYVLSGTDSEHTWRAIEDSVVLSVRWRDSG
jgi:hypothetical protein